MPAKRKAFKNRKRKPAITDKIRKLPAPPTVHHGDESKYNRKKKKHPEDISE